MPEETGDDPLQELRADSAPRHLVPAGPGVAFAPWEKPRKQYVRHYQWRVALEKVIQRLPPNQSVISYLGLIGPRLLDIRDFAPICVGAGKKLKFLGFKSRSTVAEDTTLSLGLHELRSRGMVLPSSDVIPDDIESLADSRSVAYSRAEEYGPFDVVNLDLCDSIADGGGSGRPRHFDVITRLIAVQRGRRSPWALLLTCRGDKGAVDGSDFTRMSRYVAMNIQTASGFRSRFEEMFSAPLGGLFAGGREICLGDVESLTGVNFLKLFGTAVAKWLLKVATADQPRITIEMVGGFYYQVAREPDMLALAFFITPPPPSAIDQANLAAFSRATVPDEAAMGLQMLNDLSVIEDVDAVLQLHHVNDAICRENAVLLEQAGYPRADCYTFCGLAAPDEAVPAESDPLEL